MSNNSLWIRAFNRAVVKLKALLEITNVKRFGPQTYHEAQRMLRLEMGLLVPRGNGIEVEGHLTVLPT